MREFRKLFDLPAVRLARVDIENLANLVTEGIPAKRENDVMSPIKFSIEVDSSNYTSHSIEELLSHSLPNRIDSISFNIKGWTDDNDIDRGISIDLHRTFAKIYIHAIDEVWFKGKIEQINDFFKKRRPWYGNFHNIAPGVFGIVSGILITLSIISVYKDKSSFLVFSIPVLIGMFLVSWPLNKGTIFLLVDIRLDAKPHAIDRETLAMAIAAVAALGTVAGVVIQLIDTAGP